MYYKKKKSMSVIKCLQLKVTYDQNKCYTSAICKSGRSLVAAVALDCFCEFDHGPFKTVCSYNTKLQYMDATGLKMLNKK